MKDRRPESWVGTSFFETEKDLNKVVFWNVDSKWAPKLVGYPDLRVVHMYKISRSDLFPLRRKIRLNLKNWLRDFSVTMPLIKNFILLFSWGRRDLTLKFYTYVQLASLDNPPTWEPIRSLHPRKRLWWNLSLYRKTGTHPTFRSSIFHNTHPELLVTICLCNTTV